MQFLDGASSSPADSPPSKTSDTTPLIAIDNAKDGQANPFPSKISDMTLPVAIDEVKEGEAGPASIEPPSGTEKGQADPVHTTQDIVPLVPNFDTYKDASASVQPLLIDTPDGLMELVGRLNACRNKPASLFIDLEGNELGRNGTLSLVTILIASESKLYIVDVTSMGLSAFDTKNASGASLKGILQAEDIMKVFFDVRTDSDALYSHYGVNLASVVDLQLMEIATRDDEKICVYGLARCIERNATISPADNAEWQEVKANGRAMCSPRYGGTWAAFDKRPLHDDLLRYSAQDVIYMPDLWMVYREKIDQGWWDAILCETKIRIHFSQSDNFTQFQGEYMTLAPTTWNLRGANFERVIFDNDNYWGNTGEMRYDQSQGQHQGDDEDDWNDWSDYDVCLIRNSWCGTLFALVKLAGRGGFYVEGFCCR